MATFIFICNCKKKITMASNDPYKEIDASYSIVNNRLYIICPSCREASKVPKKMFPYVKGD